MVPYRTGYKTGLQHLTDRVQPICRAYYEDSRGELWMGGDWWKTNNKLEICRWHNITCQLPVHKKESRNFSKYLVQESARYNMYINARKSKIMVVSRQDNIAVQVDHEGESLEQVHDFKFLGSNKSADGDCTKEIKRRIAMARQKLLYWPVSGKTEI